ncbi:hypothetical protein [Pseudoxanthomonas dokdonensis]|uniref:Uncharacterized protein n=1 Tax=Pseudoxanthomonas dokdonensis TaxID=344882 RepID=A0A0R0CLT4_9GAMM|nr:hypothetical protein [Pseudoxanthomonas dokdonensis]KRG70523.1 hypothetical protein ABB29_05450 [Pseudoxanthomonas dokdonensis]
MLIVIPAQAGIQPLFEAGKRKVGDRTFDSLKPGLTGHPAIERRRDDGTPTEIQEKSDLPSTNLSSEW